MKQFYKLLLVILAALASSLTASAYDFMVDGIYYNKLSDNVSVGVTSGDTVYSGDIVIPSSVNYEGTTFSVAVIEWRAFFQSRITSVVIPNSVTSIGQNAFSYTSLTSVEIPNSVSSIAYGMFEGCSKLTTILIPNSVTMIEGYAFEKSGLTSITIPNSVTKIGNYAFSGCTGLTKLVIPNSVTSIGDHAFFNCSGLTSVVIGNSANSIIESAFRRCSALTELISLNTTPPRVGVNCLYEIPTSSCVLKVPAQSVELYKVADQWKDFLNIVGLSDEEIIALGIETPAVKNILAERAFDLQGQPVGAEYKGIVIKNGRKIVKN